MTEPYRPLIAVVGYHLAPGRVTRWPEGGYGVPGPYLDALRRADARILIVSPGETNDPEEILAPFDGLDAGGRRRRGPARYGAEPDVEHNYGVEPDRDRLEIDLLLAADRMHLPTLAICRGMQVMNVAFGGTLHQHLPDMPGMLEHGVPVADTISTHDVKAAPLSRLLATAGVAVLACSSHHHQGIDRVGAELVATGWSEDGLVEALERVVDDPYQDGRGCSASSGTRRTRPRATRRSRRSSTGSPWCRSGVGPARSPARPTGRSREYGLVDYDPAWPASFEEEAGPIRDALGDIAIRIDHVGSTSVPGLAAKPVIDIQVSVRSLIPRADVVDPLVAVGYRHSIDPIETEHEFLQQEDTAVRAHGGPHPPVRSRRRVGASTPRVPRRAPA